MKREEVIVELSQVIDPRPDTEIDMKLLAFEEYLAGCHMSSLDLSEQAVRLAGRGTFWWEVILLAVGRLVHLSGDIDKPLMLANELCPRRSLNSTAIQAARQHPDSFAHRGITRTIHLNP